jgi:hypothetical protein
MTALLELLVLELLVLELLVLELLLLELLVLELLVLELLVLELLLLELLVLELLLLELAVDFSLGQEVLGPSEQEVGAGLNPWGKGRILVGTFCLPLLDHQDFQNHQKCKNTTFPPLNNFKMDHFTLTSITSILLPLSIIHQGLPSNLQPPSITQSHNLQLLCSITQDLLILGWVIFWSSSKGICL